MDRDSDQSEVPPKPHRARPEVLDTGSSARLARTPSPSRPARPDIESAPPPSNVVFAYIDGRSTVPSPTLLPVHQGDGRISQGVESMLHSSLGWSTQS